MSKYIDSEKLIAEIEGLLKLAQNKEENEGDFFFSGEIQGYKNIITIIDSLQQDPRFPLYDNIVEKVFGAGNLDGWERDEAEILVALAKEELLKSLQQEQPEVDLDKQTIIDYVHNHYHYDKDFDGYGHSNLRPVFTREDLTELARHFYELGLNARKEETK